MQVKTQRMIFQHWRSITRYRQGLMSNAAALQTKMRRITLLRAMAGWVAERANKEEKRRILRTATQLLCFGSRARTFHAWRHLTQASPA